MTARNDVVVGLDGSRSGWRALDWAAEEAEATGARLLVVHASPPGSDPGADGWADPGADLLARAVARVADDRPGLRTAARLGAGRPDRVLLDSLGAGSLLVVGRGGHRVSTGHLGATARHVLAHAPCPTVVVGGTDRIGSDSIVVGVSDSPGGRAALRFAAERARSRGWELVAVRGRDEGCPAERNAAVLASWVTRARREFPDVELRPVLAGCAADKAVECEAVDAGLVVLGCHRADTVKVGRLGMLTTALARDVSCPVAVVGHAAVVGHGAVVGNGAVVGHGASHARAHDGHGVAAPSDVTQSSTRLPMTSGR